MNKVLISAKTVENIVEICDYSRTAFPHFGKKSIGLRERSLSVMC